MAKREILRRDGQGAA